MKYRGVILILYLKSCPDIRSPTQLTDCTSRCFRVTDHSRPVAMADWCYCPGPCWPHKIVQQSTGPIRPLVDSRVCTLLTEVAVHCTVKKTGPPVKFSRQDLIYS